MWKTLGNTLWTRVVLSYRSTLIGIACGGGLLILDALTGALTKAHPGLAPTLAMLATLAGAALRSKQQSALAEAQKEIASPPSAGFARLYLLLLLAVGTLLVTIPLHARADSPLYGGCLANQTTCFAPSVSLSLVSVSLQDGSVTTGVAPGVGYGMTLHADRWYQFGAAGYVSFRDTATGQAIVPSLVLSFANYARLGLGIQVGKGNKPFLLLGVGSDFGSAPSK